MARRKECVTKADCEATMSPLVEDITTIKKALVGEDLRGGIVKDVGDLIQKVDVIVEDGKNARDISLAWKLTIVTACASAVVALIGILATVV